MTTTHSQSLLPSGNGIIAVVPAAGVGKRMGSTIPKQYLTIGNKTILEHTVEKLLSHPGVSQVVIAISEGDEWYPETGIAGNDRVVVAPGGKERADSVLSALKNMPESEWVLVHDAARPCVTPEDISALIDGAMNHHDGAILAAPVRDTMKRSTQNGMITETVEREHLWHALTPQMFRREQLLRALEKALQEGAPVTDEASAIEYCGGKPKLVCGRADNIKITQPEDLALAAYYLTQQNNG